MFVRVKNTPNSPRQSVQIVESSRVGDKVKQKIVRHVGIAHSEYELVQLKDLAQNCINQILAERAQAQGDMFHPSAEDFARGRKPHKKLSDVLPVSEVSLGDVEEQERVVEGVHEVAGSVFDTIFGKLLPSERDRELLKDIVLARIVQPCSKRHSQAVLERHFSKTHHLDRIYRLMDKLFPRIDAIKKCSFQYTKSLFSQGVEVILFDVTTLYFESVETDELRKFGYSKDHRFNTTQVVLALATNPQGLPVGYELFEGNKAEVSTLIAAIDSWKDFLRIESVCFIGDRAMFSKNNIAMIVERGYQYVIAAKLKKLPKNIQHKLFDETNYQASQLDNQFAWVSDIEYGDQRLIVSYKTKRARKDKKDREAVLEKLNKLMGSGTSCKKLVNNRAIKQYVDIKGGDAKLNTEAIEKAEQWDGLHGVVTNLTSESAADVLAKYGRLWVIEESFRVNKHTLQMRPIYHWKPERIHAHIALCYMAFSVLRHLQYLVNLTSKVSINSIIEELLSVQASIHKHKRTGDLYRMPGCFTNQARKIYKAMGVKRSQDAHAILNS